MMIYWSIVFYGLASWSLLMACAVLIIFSVPANRYNSRLHATLIVLSLISTLCACIADELGLHSHLLLGIFLVPCLISIADLHWLWCKRRQIWPSS